MKSLLAMVALAFLSAGCAGQGGTSSPVKPVVFSDANFMFTPMVPWNGKRFVYIHGSAHGSSHQSLIDVPLYASLTNDLLATGWQVVMFDRPGLYPDNLTDGGSLYASLYEMKLNQLITWADMHYGPATEYDVGGISFGGVHSLMAAVLDKRFKKYFGGLPVTDIGQLAEFKGMKVPYFNPIDYIDTLDKRQGYIMWNLYDPEVNGALTSMFVEELVLLNAPIGAEALDVYTHSLTVPLDVVADFLNQ